MAMDDQSAGAAAPTKTLSYLVAALWFALAVSAIATGLALGKEGMAAFGVGVLVFVSAFAVGSSLGFLFGIPRVPDRSSAPTTAREEPPPGKTGPTVTAQVAQEAKRQSLLNSNTNLERISDWLTTMLVGATLVQLYKINELLVAFRDFLSSYAKVFTDDHGSHNAGILPAIGPVILVLGAVLGFLFMYLNTRLILIRFFNDVEIILSGEKLGRGESNEIRNTLGDLGPTGNFVQKALSRRPNLSVQDALDAMRVALYRTDGYKSAIKAGETLANSSAVRSAWYWYLMAAAFGQQYRYSKEATEKTSAKDNAFDAARQAIALNASYRAGLKSLTDPKKTDDDLAELYRDDSRLKKLLDQA